MDTKPFTAPKPTVKPTTTVISQHEAELIAERARLEAELAMNRVERNKSATKKIIITVIVTVVLLAIVGTIVSILISTLTSGRPGNTPRQPDDPTESGVLPTVEGYSCTTSTCSKVADLSEDQILVRDTAYYVYDREADEAMKTTIEATDFRSFTPFYWGEKLLLVLERTTGRQGLYSISANRALTDSYNYTSFDRDIASSAYQGMEWVAGSYILGVLDTQQRLINISTGAEVVRASVKIFADRDFLIGYEAEGQRRLYTTTGTRFFVADAPSTLIIYDHHLAVVTGERSFDIYDTAGTKLAASDEYYRTLRDQLRAANQPYTDALRALSGAFVIPD